MSDQHPGAPTTPAPAPPAPTDVRDPAPVVAGAPTVKQTERPHPLTPFIRGWLVFVAIVFGFGRELIPDGQSGGGIAALGLRWILLVIAVVIVLAAAAGYVSWRFTRFVIDDEELRVETGVLFKTSRKIAFERLQSVDIIQPLAARMFGLAELRVEAGAGDSSVRLRYLGRANASRLRDYLLTRAHGTRASVAGLGAGSVASAFTDAGRDERALVTVTPQRLVGSFLLSTEWLSSVLVIVVILVVTAVLGVGVIGLGTLIPMVIGSVSLVGRRVLAMFNFTLAESVRGLRITRGLTNLTSQSVPVDRIQGVKLSQSLLWRRPGWWRVDVDIVGYGSSSKENNDSGATSVLLPVADRHQVAAALSRVLPGFDVDAVPLRRPPRRAAWLHWWNFWTLHSGWDERAVVTEHGWLVRERHIVPHAKTQSVRIEQGPLQRRLRLANVHVDTPKGPVHVTAQELDPATARELALGQLDRARMARAADRERRPVDEVEPASASSAAAVTDLLADFHTSGDRMLGEGGESEVFALDDPSRVLRVYRTGHEGPEQVVGQLRQLLGFWSGAPTPLELPQLLDAGHRHGRFYTVDQRFAGGPLSTWLRTADATERRPVLLTLLDATEAISRLPLAVPGFARLVGPEAPRSYRSLGELAGATLTGPTSRSRVRLEQDLPDVAGVWDRLHRELAERVVEPRVVHGDLAASNVYVSAVESPSTGSGNEGPSTGSGNEGPSTGSGSEEADAGNEGPSTGSGNEEAGSGVRVVGVGDFSPHTLQADPLLDLTGAVTFLELEPYPEAAADSAWLLGAAVDRYGRDVAHWIGVYRRYYGFYFSDTFRFDPATYGWCLRQLDAG